MSHNKHAQIRYLALDKCFRNFGKQYFIEDLIEACNNAIYKISPDSDGIKRRQILYDIKFMESEQGFNIPLERLKDGKKTYYRYTDKSFTISKQPVNDTEIKQIQETLNLLTRFKGLPQFNWMEELWLRMDSTIKLKDPGKPIVGFDQNENLEGIKKFTDYFNAIQNKEVLQINYKSFRQQKEIKVILHPYYLKQYNKRWFLFGFNEELQKISNLALDRIKGYKPIRKKKYIENTDIDFDIFFDDVIGVTIPERAKEELIRIKVSKELWPYIDTKPLHHSQINREKKSDAPIITIKLIPNYELESLLLSYGEGLEVLEPLEFRNRMAERIKKLNKLYP